MLKRCAGFRVGGYPHALVVPARRCFRCLPGQEVFRWPVVPEGVVIGDWRHRPLPLPGHWPIASLAVTTLPGGSVMTYRASTCSLRR
jgi:hypothetical protein